MALAVGNKRKREGAVETESQPKARQASHVHVNPGTATTTPAPKQLDLDQTVHVQVVMGSYERILYGFSATIPARTLKHSNTASHPVTGQQGQAEFYSSSHDLDQDGDGKDREEEVVFSDTFLFAAHASSIRCIAISPPTTSDKRLLATGSADERINVYSIATTPPAPTADIAMSTLPTLSSSSTAENPRNRSLGSLTQHDRPVTRLQFPTKAKLFSAAEDNTIAISRTRDWTMLSSIKAPISKAQGRPSGDTAGPGETPAGINDFAIHPSQKLMLSVGRGERGMRLWNLMTGRKAGVLKFDRDLLVQVGEGRHSTGEGRRLMWDAAGLTFVVCFERAAALFGMDSMARALFRPAPLTKLHHMRYLPGLEGVLAISTEDGRVLFFDTSAVAESVDRKSLPVCSCIAQLGGQEVGVSGRVKDFEILSLPRLAGTSDADALLVVAASSDGAVRLWVLSLNQLASLRTARNGESDAATVDGLSESPKPVGALVAIKETGSRLTCVAAFVMDGKVGAVSADDETVLPGSDHHSERGEVEDDNNE